MTAVTAFGSSVCNFTKGELLIHAANPVPHTYADALGRCPWKEFRTFIPAFMHVGFVVRGKQVFVAI